MHRVKWLSPFFITTLNTHLINNCAGIENGNAVFFVACIISCIMMRTAVINNMEKYEVLIALYWGFVMKFLVFNTLK